MPVPGHGPASSTVTLSTLPSSVKIWVMPSLRARMAAIRRVGSRCRRPPAGGRGAGGGRRSSGSAGGGGGGHSGGSVLDVAARRQVVEALEGVDGLRGRLVDVDQPLVGPDLEV